MIPSPSLWPQAAPMRVQNLRPRPRSLTWYATSMGGLGSRVFLLGWFWFCVMVFSFARVARHAPSLIGRTAPPNQTAGRGIPRSAASVRVKIGGNPAVSPKGSIWKRGRAFDHLGV